MGCLSWVSPRPLGRACWRCLVVPVLLQLGVPLEISAWMGMSCVRRVSSFGGRIMCGLWWPGFCGQPLVGFCGCVVSVVPIWCG